MKTNTTLRMGLGLAILGTVGVLGIGFAPAAHAQSIGVPPTLSASLTTSGATEQITFSGSGFTPGGSVTINVYDLTTSNALVQTFTVPASAATPSVTYVNSTQWVCTPSAYGYQGQYCPSGQLCQLGQYGYSGQYGYQGQYGQNGQYTYPSPYGQGCQMQTVAVPETTYVGGGTLSTTLTLSSYTTDTLMVQAVDGSSGVASNQVQLAAPLQNLTATITAYGPTNLLLLSGSGYTYTTGSTLSVEIVDTATGAVLASYPLAQQSYYPMGTLAASLPVPVPAMVNQLGVRVFNPSSGWHGNYMYLSAHR